MARFTAAGHGDALSTFLEVLEQEAEDRRQRRIGRLRTASRLPSGKTVETFEHDRVPPILQQQLGELADGNLVDRGVNVLAFGLPGTGETHALWAVCRYSGPSGQCYSQTSGHPEHPWFALVSGCSWLVNHPLCLQQGPVRGQPFPVTGALDDDLVAGIGQPVQGAVAQDGVVEDAQPLLHRPVAGDDKAGDSVAVEVEDELIEVGGLLGGEPV